jgi:hypothetical protein
MKGSIYLIQDDDQLVEMNEEPYDSEDLLQEFLAKYPKLLAGDQMDAAVPRRWLLVSRETPVPGEEGSGGRWSVDHLFLDQDAIPTLVEVKRSSDTRIRREVVGQMLDYAANAVAYWPVESIRAKFEATCESQGADPTEKVSELIEPGREGDAAVETFWNQVKTNLQAGRIRLVFVADEIPQELRQIVEFLSAQMDPAEVLAVEIKQYVGDEHKTLVPRVIGQRAKPVPARRKWDEPSFFLQLESRRNPQEASVARKILEWATEGEPRIRWGKGTQDGSFVPVLEHQGKTHSLIGVWTYGTLEIQFEYMTKPPFSSESERLDFLHRLNRIPGISIPEDAISRRPPVKLSVLEDETALKQFLETLDWAIEKIMNS